MNEGLNKKLEDEFNELLGSDVSNVQRYLFFRWFDAGTKSKTLRDYYEKNPSREMVDKIVELAREGIGTESLYNDYDYSVDEIIAELNQEDGK